MKWLQHIWAGIVIAVLIPCLLARLTAVGVGLVWSRRRTRRAFHRRLVRAGLSEAEADALTARYHARFPLAELARLRHSRRRSP